jgi:hypothetical protein
MQPSLMFTVRSTSILTQEHRTRVLSLSRDYRFCFISGQEQEQTQKFLNVFSSPSSPPAAPASVANYPMTSVDSTTEDLSPMRVAGGSIRWNHNTDAIQVKNFRKIVSSERQNKLERLHMQVLASLI